MKETQSKIAVIGGTGALGAGLARRWALAGYPVVIGSRRQAAARDAAASLAEDPRISGGETEVTGADNAEAAATADIVVLTVPFAHQGPILESIAEAVQGKLLIDATAPLVPPKVMRVQLPAEGSAAQAAQLLLGEGVQVVSALQNVSAELLGGDEEIACDVLVAGDSREARARVVELLGAIGLRGLHAGPLANAAAAEALTSVLIAINKHHGAAHAGIRITGV